MKRKRLRESRGMKISSGLTSSGGMRSSSGMKSSDGMRRSGGMKRFRGMKEFQGMTAAEGMELFQQSMKLFEVYKRPNPEQEIQGVMAAVGSSLLAIGGIALIVVTAGAATPAIGGVDQSEHSN